MILKHYNRMHKLPNYIVPKVVTSVAAHDNHCTQVWEESQNVLAQLCTYLFKTTPIGLDEDFMVVLVSYKAKNKQHAYACASSGLCNHTMIKTDLVIYRRDHIM